MTSTSRQLRLRDYWDRLAGSYDRRTSAVERRFFADARPWVCGQARGRTLEVAIGTGLNLPYYPVEVDLTGLEWSAGMLDVARGRAARLGRAVELRQGDATALPYPDATFDTVVCTFSLCGIGDERTALREMVRVLRPGGLLLLADHVASSVWPVRIIQALADLVTVPWYGEHFGRRPARTVETLDVTVERRERHKLGTLEWLAARKPADHGADRHRR